MIIKSTVNQMLGLFEDLIAVQRKLSEIDPTISHVGSLNSWINMISSYTWDVMSLFVFGLICNFQVLEYFIEID